MPEIAIQTDARTGADHNIKRWRSFLTIKLSVNARLMLAGIAYVVATAVVWQHFFYKRIQQMEAKLGDPRQTTNYQQKRVVPPFVYSTKHTIMLTMAVLLLSMCRKTVGALSRTTLNRFLPLDSTVEVHKALGKWMVAQTVFCFFGFMVQYGSLCALYLSKKESENFCAKFGGEIFITGVILTVMCVVMLVTALPHIRRRFKWSFEVFWNVHHTFIALYILTIIHTIDNFARKDLHSRSQAGLWLVPPMLLYIFDRCWQHVTVRDTYLSSVKILTKPKALVIKLARPDGWQYNCGQYARLNVPAISESEWHPFSISSAPHQDHVEFFIAVVQGGWTERLYQRVQDVAAAGQKGGIAVKLDGPYGSQLQGAFNSPDMVLMSTGTGVVPMLSVLRQLTATPSVEVSASQSRLKTTHKALDSAVAAHMTRKGLKQYEVLNQRFWMEADVVYSTDDARSKAPSLSSLRAPGSRRFHYGPASFKLADTTQQLLINRPEGSTSSAPKGVRHPGEYAQQVFRSPDAVYSLFSQMQRRQVLYAISVRDTWWSLGSLLLAGLQLLLCCLQVSWASGSMLAWPGWYVVDALTILSALGMLVYVIRQAHNAHTVYYGRTPKYIKASMGRLQRIRRSLANALHTLLHSGEDGVEAMLTDSSWFLHLLVAAGLVLVASIGPEEAAEGDHDSTLLICLTSILRLYHVMYQLNTTPLFLIKGPENAKQLSLKASFARSVHFSWSTQTADSFKWVMEELEEIACQLVALRGRGFLDMRISITRATEDEKAELRRLLQGTLLEGSIRFGRLSYGDILRDVCDRAAAAAAEPSRPSIAQHAPYLKTSKEGGQQDTALVVDATGRVDRRTEFYMRRAGSPSSSSSSDGGGGGVLAEVDMRDVEAGGGPARGPAGVQGCRVLALFFCGHPGIAADLEKAVDVLSKEAADKPGAPMIMYGSETVFG